MERSEILKTILKLQNFEKLLNEGQEDTSFFNELNKTLEQLSSEINSENTFHPSVNVRVKKLSENAKIPSYSKDGDAGLDLTVTKIISETKKDITYGYDLAFEIPKGYVGLLFPRSSVKNKDLLLTNCVGVIDSGFRGEIQTTFKKTDDGECVIYSVGDRACQMIIIPYPKVNIIVSDELNYSERGDGGFGSTGN